MNVVGAVQTQARRSRNRERTKSALLASADEVFSRKGFDAASLDEIAASAGYTRGAVHHHFASKNDLFLAVIARRDAELLAGYGPDLFGDHAGDAAATEATAARWRELHANSEAEVALRLELRSNAIRNADLRERLLTVEGAAVAATAARLTRAADARAARRRTPPAEVAELLHIVSHGLAERSALSGVDMSSLMGSFVAMAWRELIDEP